MTTTTHPADRQRDGQTASLTESELAAVTGGQVSIPYKEIKVEYKEQDSKG
jgi:hypothetical protein